MMHGVHKTGISLLNVGAYSDMPLFCFLFVFQVSKLHLTYGFLQRHLFDPRFALFIFVVTALVVSFWCLDLSEPAFYLIDLVLIDVTRGLPVERILRNFCLHVLPAFFKEIMQRWDP
jgi:hypothetical protein